MLTTLRHIIQEVAKAPDFRAALDITVSSIVNAFAAGACSIFLLDRQYREYVLMATHGLNPDAVLKVRVPINKGLIGLVGEREEPINLMDAKKHPRYLECVPIQEEQFSAFLGTPIIHQRQILGVLMVQQAAPKRFDESEEAFLVTLAAQLAAIIAHAESSGNIWPQSTSKASSENAVFSSNTFFNGMPGAAGIGIGTGVYISTPYHLDAVPDRVPEDIESEINQLYYALATVREDLRLMSEKLYPSLATEERAVFDAYQRILDSADLGKEVVETIRAGNWAPGALRHSIQTHVQHLENAENEYLRERVSDIKDLGMRVLTYLQKNTKEKPKYPVKTILLGDTLTPTDLAEVPEGALVGIVSTKGSSSSHVAILARAMKVPTVMGMNEAPLASWQNKELIVDGYFGQVHVSPNASVHNEFERLIQEEQKLDARLEAIRDLPAITKDGHAINLLVNTGLGADISISLKTGADGVGLYRTEIPFVIRDRFPSSEEQRIIYRQLLASFAPGPVTIRTLDIGGDKPLPYFPIKEENPFLGWRGMRITLDHPEIFLGQIRAMLRANLDFNNLRIMLPMITEVGEVDEAIRLIKKAYDEILEEGQPIQMPQIGVMIEVPAAVYQARSLAKRVDFLSVGSNDLTQYILAVDRNNPRVAYLYDALHPAVLRALIQVVENGHQEGKHVSICGELAGDPVATMLLLAIGFDSLSMNASSVGKVRWITRNVTKKKCAKLLQEVLGLESAALVRCHMELALERMGLGDLIRMGRKC